MSMTDPVILICTVGGSHEPILTAIHQTAPSYVCFICSGEDPATARPGSETQITGKGKIIKKHFRDDKPTLLNIPSQAGLDPDRYEVILVPTDDLGGAFKVICEALSNLAVRYPGARYLADYTGGTKTMTAALVTAALENDQINLQLVTGSRSDLVQVRSGMESATPANVEGIRLERAMAPYIAGWRRFAYSEAAIGLAHLPTPGDSVLAVKLRIARDFSRALDAWDRFDHEGALQILDNYRKKIGPKCPELLVTIKTLAKSTPQQEPMRLFDLWRNAQRRAVQGRYDDAVARIYRFLEWIAQWVLRSHCNIDTADVPGEYLPEGIDQSSNRAGKFQVGLFGAWELVEKQAGGAAGEFITANRNKLKDHIQVRNYSILAHGLNPITQNEWNKLIGWVDDQVIPMLESEASALKIRQIPSQLPTELSQMY